MSSAPTLYVAISPHGFGHISQTAPVVNELVRRHRDLRIVIECSVPHETLARRFTMPFTHVPCATDFGMVMENALTPAAEKSHARYVAFHEDLDRHVAEAAYRITEHRPHLVLCNVPYVSLVAAKRLGVRAVGMCCLNWADIYRGICGEMPGASVIHEQLVDAYRQADVFITPAPTMPMSGLSNTVACGPVATVGRRQRDWLLARLKLLGDQRLVLISMGGIATNLDLACWPTVQGITWMTDLAVPAGRNDMVNVDNLSMPYLEVMCSSDAILCKPGYGTFVEAACNGIPILYVPRHDWPEAPSLVEWLKAHGRCAEIRYEDLFSDRLGHALERLWSQPERPLVAPTGVTEAADIIEKYV